MKPNTLTYYGAAKVNLVFIESEERNKTLYTLHLFLPTFASYQYCIVKFSKTNPDYVQQQSVLLHNIK